VFLQPRGLQQSRITERHIYLAPSKMKSFFSIILLAASVVAVPQADAYPTVCLAVCRPDKPTCPPGQAPTGSEGCWGCCQPVITKPVDPILCTAVCRPEKPVCPSGQAPTGSEGCWGCCQPITTKPEDPIICTAVCRTEKPVCPLGQAPTGSEGCWGCCQPI